jgi:hypothetical protein
MKAEKELTARDLTAFVYQPLYTVKETAGILKTSVNAVYELMNAGELPYLILGKKKIRGTDLRNFIEGYPTEGSRGA